MIGVGVVLVWWIVVAWLRFEYVSVFQITMVCASWTALCWVGWDLEYKLDCFVLGGLYKLDCLVLGGLGP